MSDNSKKRKLISDCLMVTESVVTESVVTESVVTGNDMKKQKITLDEHPYDILCMYASFLDKYQVNQLYEYTKDSKCSRYKVIKKVIKEEHIGRKYWKLDDALQVPDRLLVRNVILADSEDPENLKQFPRLKGLICIGSFNQSLDQMLPQGLETLDLGTTFNQSIRGPLPESLRELKITIYDKPLQGNILPQGLKKLTFEASFNPMLETLI